MRVTTDPLRKPGALRRFAVLCGLVGALAAVAVPFLPVQYEITTLHWPTEQGTRAVSAPLSAYQPIRLDLRVPCATARSLDARSPDPAVLLSTNPPEAEYGDLTGLRLEIQQDRLRLLVRGQQLGTARLPEGDCEITVHSDGAGTTASAGDAPIAQAAGDIRPQLTGIYSDVDGNVDEVRGLSFSAEVDDRYDSHPSPLKLGVMALAVLGCAGSLVALRRIDGVVAHRIPRRTRRWPRPTPRDALWRPHWWRGG